MIFQLGVTLINSMLQIGTLGVQFTSVASGEACMRVYSEGRWNQLTTINNLKPYLECTRAFIHNNKQKFCVFFEKQTLVVKLFSSVRKESQHLIDWHEISSLFSCFFWFIKT